MPFFAYEFDYADMDKRAATREEHLAYLNDLAARGRVVFGGPYHGETAGLIVYRATHAAAAQQMIDEDPYTREDVTANRLLHQWNVVVRDPEVKE